MPLVDCESSDISCGLGFSYKASSFATDIFKDIVPSLSSLSVAGEIWQNGEVSGYFCEGRARGSIPLLTLVAHKKIEDDTRVWATGT